MFSPTVVVNGKPDPATKSHTPDEETSKTLATVIFVNEVTRLVPASKDCLSIYAT